jgi:hypothetical protein
MITKEQVLAVDEDSTPLSLSHFFDGGLETK